MAERFLVWSNEHNAWWGPCHCGYTPDIEAAGRYSLEDAINICNQANYAWDVNFARPHEMPIAESAALLLNKQRRAA